MITPISQLNTAKPANVSLKAVEKPVANTNRNVTFNANRFNPSLIQKVMESISERNLIGEGRNSKVYKFFDNSFDKYVIKVLKPNSSNQIELNVLPEYNFGQAIFKIQDNIYILKKQNGIQHGFIDWEKQCQCLKIEREKAQNFVKSVKRISEMPNETFDEFARKTKYITDNGYKSDSINPNNLLIDYKNNEINVIDYFKTNNEIKSKNSYLDMACCILDFLNFERIYSALPESEQKEFINVAKLIMEKCYNSAKKVGLSTDKRDYEEFLSRVSTILNAKSLLPNYKDFKELVRVL